ncbi:hypothetical protein SNEBB_007982, partial [Seison nebaliae]
SKKKLFKALEKEVIPNDWDEYDIEKILCQSDDIINVKRLYERFVKEEVGSDYFEQYNSSTELNMAKSNTPNKFSESPIQRISDSLSDLDSSLIMNSSMSSIESTNFNERDSMNDTTHSIASTNFNESDSVSNKITSLSSKSMLSTTSQSNSYDDLKTEIRSLRNEVRSLMSEVRTFYKKSSSSGEKPSPYLLPINSLQELDEFKQGIEEPTEFDQYFSYLSKFKGKSIFQSFRYVLYEIFTVKVAKQLKLTNHKGNSYKVAIAERKLFELLTNIGIAIKMN